ncbi:hypothetical protein BKP45_12835 [Anaerobacillus alkalidiazotrophicus]|uniref:Uncharacterized protein n=1 Tax=Anaerobacillus alkalidiazotrophicus TaxID=472963 RepID=A0A1S2M5B1_9BACI|nr:hypothetical protein [Anaerobacillus alkalidiazotrophicus]OIJ18450.1 hypothetical protein BKP45_18550 [Anaerobacillus alkalidiazotrophicus]OIJ19929.1 hypothetical protein BKP45_12835 [Anaerobacillus alkalidiazotrophicus]
MSHKDDNLIEILQASVDQEEEMMRTYLIAAERIHESEELKLRLREFAEGNAKRSRQLMDEIKRIDLT